MPAPTAWKIRSAHSSDAERLLDIRQRAILELAVPTLSVQQAQAWAAGRDLAWMEGLISTSPLWVACLEGAVAGWVAVEDQRVIGLYVDPPYSCRGIGSRLLAVAEHELSSRGSQTIELEASWNSEGFYLRRGYEPLTDRPAMGPRPMRKTLIAT